MSTARRRLRSPRSPSGICTHHGHTKLLQYFKLEPWNVKVKVMGVVKGQGHIVGSVSNWFISFSFHINQTNNSWDTVISKFELEKSTINVMGEFEVTQSTRYGSNPYTSFSFYVNRTTIHKLWAIECLTLKKTHPKFKKKNPKIVSDRVSSNTDQVISIPRGYGY